MPTYEYQCKKCGHVLEDFQSITAPPLVHCPNCHTDSLVRIMGGGAGVIFKGTGFYQTDYKKSNSAGAPKSKKGPHGGEKGATGSGESGSAGSGSESSGAGEGKKEKQEKKDSPAKGSSPGGSSKE